MNNEEHFVKRCARVDFDGQGLAQARVWVRIASPRPAVWKKWAFVSACAALLFAAGMGFSRWINGSVIPAAENRPCVSAPEPYFLLCVKRGGRSEGYCCRKHSFYGEDFSQEEAVFPPRRECARPRRPDLPSFYTFNQSEC